MSPKLNGEAVHTMMKRKSTNWIAGAIKKPGALHKELGIKAGNKIPAKTLASAAKKGGKEGQRARLAETLKGFKKSKRAEPTIKIIRGDIEKKSAKRKGTVSMDGNKEMKSAKKKKMAALPAGKAYGTPMAVPKAMQNSKNPSWVKGKKSKKV